MARGIDYGMGTTNRDPKTGIRYGVISQNEVLQSWCDSSEAVYPDPETVTCEACGGEGLVEEEKCEDCGGEGTVEEDMEFAEPSYFEYNDDGYVAHCGNDGDIFVTKSPYFTRAAFCSPCAPGACYLMSPCEDGERAYCFGHDWFEDGRAPYPVFSVETGEEIHPTK
jgi:hypothetical protein